jgi:hypothetical protein
MSSLAVSNWFAMTAAWASLPDYAFSDNLGVPAPKVVYGKAQRMGRIDSDTTSWTRSRCCRSPSSLKFAFGIERKEITFISAVPSAFL